jgi:hypothetical protein
MQTPPFLTARLVQIYHLAAKKNGAMPLCPLEGCGSLQWAFSGTSPVFLSRNKAISCAITPTVMHSKSFGKRVRRLLNIFFVYYQNNLVFILFILGQTLTPLMGTASKTQVTLQSNLVALSWSNPVSFFAKEVDQWLNSC